MAGSLSREQKNKYLDPIVIAIVGRYDDLMNPNPSCAYVTLDNMREAKRVKRNNYKEGLARLKSISRYDIKNALTCKYLPLSDQEHGANIMMSPELLHTSGSGLITYIFESLRNQIGSGKDRDDIDKQHGRMYMIIKRQSERDFPRGAMRNGLIDGTKCQAERGRETYFYCCVLDIHPMEVISYKEH